MTIKDIPFNCSKHFKDYPCSHRQWKHKGHCRYVHGYSRSFTFCFASNELDENGFVVDFSSLRPLEEKLREHFDHTLLVAINDPHKDEIKSLDKNKIARIVEVPEISCEKFAEMTFKFIDNHFNVNDYNVKVLSVEVSEHPGNTAGYYGE